MTGRTPRTIADLDVSESVLLAALAAAHTPQEDLAYREALYLVRHPEVQVSTMADYPSWVPAHTDPADYVRSAQAGYVTPVDWVNDPPESTRRLAAPVCEPEFVTRPVADVETGGAL